VFAVRVHPRSPGRDPTATRSASVSKYLSLCARRRLRPGFRPGDLEPTCRFHRESGGFAIRPKHSGFYEKFKRKVSCESRSIDIDDRRRCSSFNAPIARVTHPERNMLDAASQGTWLRGDPRSRLSAKSHRQRKSAHTWGGREVPVSADADGLWAAVLQRTAERRADVFTPAESGRSPLRQNASASIIDTALRRSYLSTDSTARSRNLRAGASTRTPPPSWKRLYPAHRRRTPILGTRLDWRRAQNAFGGSQDRSRSRDEVATLITRGAMRGITS